MFNKAMRDLEPDKGTYLKHSVQCRKQTSNRMRVFHSCNVWNSMHESGTTPFTSLRCNYMEPRRCQAENNYANPCARITKPCAQITKPCARITKPCARISNPCARLSNPCARFSNRAHDLVIRVHGLVIRAHGLA